MEEAPQTGKPFVSARALELLAALLLLVTCFLAVQREYRIWTFLADLDSTAHPGAPPGAFWKQLLWKQHPFLLQVLLGFTAAGFLAAGRRFGWFCGAATAALLVIHFLRLVLHPTGLNTSATLSSRLFLAAAVAALLIITARPLREKHHITRADALVVVLLLVVLMIDKWLMLG